MKAENVNDYIAAQPVAVRVMLKQLRSIIGSVVPEAEEVISYMVPSYKYHGMLVGFGARENGCSFYAMNAMLLPSWKKKMKGVKYSASTIHFDTGEKLPVALLKKIIKHRIKENEERYLTR